MKCNLKFYLENCCATLIRANGKTHGSFIDVLLRTKLAKLLINWFCVFCLHLIIPCYYDPIVKRNAFFSSFRPGMRAFFFAIWAYLKFIFWWLMKMSLFVSVLRELIVLLSFCIFPTRCSDKKIKPLLSHSSSFLQHSYIILLSLQILWGTRWFFAKCVHSSFSWHLGLSAVIHPCFTGLLSGISFPSLRGWNKPNEIKKQYKSH